MTAAERQQHCPDAGTLAAFAEGTLPRAEVAALLAHLERCSTCMSAVEAAHHVLGETKAPQRWPLFAAAAAVAAALLLAIPAVRSALFSRESTMTKLVALAPTGARIVEPRLTGGFAYVPYRGPARLHEESADTERMKRIGVAGELADRDDHERSAASAHDAGIALLLVERPLDAAERLRAATTRAPNDAQNWSDLAAALYAGALQNDRPSLYPRALDAADRALRIAPDFAEALFNRALILERLGLTAAARDAWNRYLQIDPGSRWSEEARQRLAKLGAQTGESRFDADRPRLESAAAAGDAATTAALVTKYPQQARTWSEFEYLSRWADAAKKHDEAAADRALTMARTIGDALAKRSGESLLRDAVRVIDDSDARQRAAIAEGQLLYKQGRIAYSKQKPGEAEGDLRNAATRYASARSPMALVARYFAANTRFDRNDVAGARAELSALLRESDDKPQYAALGAQVRWELALCLLYDGDWSGALPLLTASRMTFERLGERNNLGFIDGLLATTQISLGRSDQAWASRIRAFETLSYEAHGDRLAVSIGGAAQMEIRAGRLDAARALLALEEPFDRAAQNELLLAHLFVRRAVVSAALADDEASSFAREARTISARIQDLQMRAQAEANADFAEGAAALPRDPRIAKEKLARAIAFYRTSAAPAFLPEAHLMSARASLALGDRAAALHDLDSGIEAVELHRVRYAGGVTGTGVLDAAPSLLLESIRLRLDEGDLDGAFASAERLHEQLAPAEHGIVSVAELQHRLANSDSAVLSFAVLPREVVAFCITANDRMVARQKIDENRVTALAQAFERGDAEASRALYDVLIRPSQATLAKATSLIVVPAPELETIPFAGLQDASTKRFLVESFSLATAPSASALEPGLATPAKSAVAIALPAPAPDAALPEGRGEIDAVSRLYTAATTISGNDATFPAFAAATEKADVIHIASHTEREASSDEFAFGFVDERVSWRTIATLKLRPSATVLLAACETLRRLRLPEMRTLSLGGGFVAAGAADVVGTLAPIQDADARQLFLEIHRRLVTGARIGDALRDTQRAAIAAEGDNASRGAWRAVALLTRRIPQRKTS